jgi:hypothetical protein
MPLDTASTARTELAEINEQFAAACAEHDAARQRFEPLVGPTQQLLTLIAHHRAGLKVLADEQDDQRYTAKLIELRSLERQIDHLQAEVDMEAYRLAETDLREANGRLSALADRRNELVLLVAQEEAERFLETAIIPAYARAIQVRGVADLLARAIERCGTPLAVNIARRILDRVAEVIPAIRVQGDPAASAQFLDRLVADSAAELEAPTGTPDWQLGEIRTVRQPLQDGSDHINRGPEQAPVEPTFPTDFGEAGSWAWARGTPIPPQASAE